MFKRRKIVYISMAMLASFLLGPTVNSFSQGSAPQSGLGRESIRDVQRLPGIAHIAEVSEGMTQFIQDEPEAMPFDEIEPNDRRTRPNEIPPRTLFVRGSVDPIGDTDFFSFEANEGDFVFVWVDTMLSTTSQDSTLRLQFGRRTIEMDEDDGPNPMASGIAAVQLTESGRYLLQIQEGGNNETISAYRVFLCVLPAHITDEVEPNDMADSATDAGNVNRGFIGSVDDIDAWQFSASEMDTLTIGLNQTGEQIGFDAVLEVKDQFGNLLATQNENGGEEDDPEFLTLFSLPTTGRYTVTVSAVGVTEPIEEFDYLMGICLNGRPLRRPPVADAGPDQIVFERERVNLDGSASLDVDGDVLMFEWKQIRGRQVQLSGTTTPRSTFISPEVSFLNAVDLVFELTVTNGGQLSDRDEVTIHVSDLLLLKDDDTSNQVAFEFVTPAYVWTTPTGQTFSGSFMIEAKENDIQFRGSGENEFFCNINLIDRNGKAEITTSVGTFTISDGNIDDNL